MDRRVRPRETVLQNSMHNTGRLGKDGIVELVQAAPVATPAASCIGTFAPSHAERDLCHDLQQERHIPRTHLKPVGGTYCRRYA